MSLKQALKGAQVVERGSPQHIGMIESGYGMMVEDAHAVIKEREQNPALHSIEDAKKARAMLAQIKPTKAQLQPSSDKPGWKRKRTMGVR